MVRQNQPTGALETLCGYVVRATWRLSFYKWRQVCEYCNDTFEIDEREYQMLKMYYLETHGVAIPGQRLILTDSAETFGQRVAEKDKGVGKGSLHHRVTKQPGFKAKPSKASSSQD